MNTILLNNLTFTDNPENTTAEGKLLSGSFFVENSLAHDELSIDTLRFTVRYPSLAVDLTKFTYGTPCTYHQDDTLFGKFYLVKVKRTSRYEFNFEFQSAIGLLEDTLHYGGYYKAKIASELIEEIIGGKIPYTIKQVFSKIKLYGWLPISTRRDNLKQVLFACGGCIKKNSEGNVYITTLDVNTPINIPDSRIMEGGSVEYSNINKVAVTEHAYFKSDDTESKKIFSGELAGQNFTTPKGNVVRNAALVTWKEPHYDITFENCTLLNNEVDANYAVVQASPNAIIKGKPYTHSQSIVYKEKSDYTGEEKIATVKDATLVSLANSASTAERVMAYYGSASTLNNTIITNGEKPTNIITFTDPFGDKAQGFIKSLEGNFGHSVNSAGAEIIQNYVPPVVVGSRTLVSIAVTTPPTKTSYASGDEFDPTGMIVTAKYDDNSTNVINAYFIEPNRPLKESDTEITITYTELGITKTTTTPISVVTMLRFIAITTPPDITDYYEDDVFNPAGMVVTAYYSDGSSKVVTNYTYSPTSALTKNDTTITVSYTDTGVTAKAYVDIVVGDAPNLTSIAITTPPTKTVYKIGEYFNTTGMVVTAYFDNDTSKAVSGYTYSPTTALTQDSTTITVSYTRRGITKTATQAITMKYLTKIEITAPPTYTAYYEDNNFNKAGMVVAATYSTGETRNLNEAEYTVTPTTLKVGDTQVTISYTETGITKTATQAVTVTYYPYDFTKSIVISQAGTYHLSDIGATHRNLRIVSIGGGDGGSGGSNGTSGGTGNAGIITSGSNGTSGSTTNGGENGLGGANGLKGNGGKVYSEDIILNAAGDDIVITLGQGGAGGAVGQSGAAGGDTTCTINGTVISSASGNSTPEGYTNTMTSENFASEGVDGISGGDGGNAGSQGTNGRTVGSNTGGSGSTRYASSASTQKYTRGSQTPSCRFGWSRVVYEDTQDRGAGAPFQNTTYYTGGDYISNNNNNTDKMTVSGSKRIGWGGSTSTVKRKTDGKTLRVYPQKFGRIYTNLSSVSLPTNFNNDVQGSYTQTVEEIEAGETGGSYDYTPRTNYVSRFEKRTGTKTFTYDWQVANVRSQSGYAGAGGGGAAKGANGSNASGKDGGNGANAVAPSAPTKFGAGGNGGHGGGGGGAGGDGYASISGNASWCSAGAWISGGSGGTAGSGSSGSNGAQGCVIIYFS